MIGPTSSGLVAALGAASVPGSPGGGRTRAAAVYGGVQLLVTSHWLRPRRQTKAWDVGGVFTDCQSAGRRDLNDVLPK